jgi:hypothetical protein
LTTEERAEYDKKRRATLKLFTFQIDRTRGEALEAKLKKQGLGKTEWFRRVIDDYVGKE